MLKPKNFPAGTINTIVFDFGNVLLDLDMQHCVEQFQKLGAKPDDGNADALNKLFCSHERGEYSDQAFYDALRSRAPKGVPAPTNDELRDAWCSILHKPFDPRRITLINRLRADGFRLILLSNTNPIHREFFHEKFFNDFGFDLDSLFVKAFFSDQLHCRKPEPMIYKTVAQSIYLVPQKTLFIDDVPANTSAAAKIAGWNVHTLRVGEETVLDLFEEK